MQPFTSSAVIDYEPSNPRTELLEEADRLVNGDRNNQYGDPIQDFRRTAKMMEAVIEGIIEREGGEVHVTPADVALLISCVKMSRIVWMPEKMDSWADLAGYAACGWDTVVRTRPAGVTSV
jgi:hypothetical protein